MAKQFLVSSKYCDHQTPKDLENAIDGCLSLIAGEWLTTDFEIEALTTINNPDGMIIVAVVATRRVEG